MDQSAKISLNILALVFIVLCIAALNVAVNGTDDGIYWGFLEVLAHVYDHHPQGELDLLMSLTFAIPFVSAIFFFSLVDAVTQKRGMSCAISLIIVLAALYLALVPDPVFWNPADKVRDFLQPLYAAHLMTAWRFFGFCGISAAISLRLWMP